MIDIPSGLVRLKLITDETYDIGSSHLQWV